MSIFLYWDDDILSALKVGTKIDTKQLNKTNKMKKVKKVKKKTY